METAAHSSEAERTRRLLLACGIAASFVYVGTDLIASSLTPGYRLPDQAVSELFAIGAPLQHEVAALFSLSSLLLLGFALGILRSSGGHRRLRLLALMFALSALDALILWSLFPMHMRGATPSFTDTMHLALSANPFVWVALLLGIAAFRGRFRAFSIAALVLLILPAIPAFAYAPALAAGAPTPGLGLAERASQYGYQIWQVALALMLMRRKDR